MHRGRIKCCAVLSGIVLALTMSGCASGPLAISCADYLTKDSATQLDLAGILASPGRKTAGPMDKIIAPTYQTELITYCGANPDAKLMDLEMTFGR
ncbi:MAG: hypothetical protein ABI903_10220 [Actinomycetota bacterium]